jgi:hypothetical protein
MSQRQRYKKCWPATQSPPARARRRS